MGDPAPDLIVRWPDGSSEPLTPELAQACELVVRVFPGSWVEGARRARESVERRPYWLRRQDDR